jgi:uncharacterized membrane protein (DUF485 family)
VLRTTDREAYNWKHSDRAIEAGFVVFIALITVSLALMAADIFLDWVPRIWALAYGAFIIGAIISYVIFAKENPDGERDTK